MKKIANVLKVIILILLSIFILIAIMYALGINDDIVNFFSKEETGVVQNETGKEIAIQKDINVALTMDDKIEENTAWCGTFQLIWNDLKSEVVKKDIEFTPQLEVVENLNRGKFTTSQLSESSYYKKHGIPTQELKKEIEKGIQDKFGEESDILDSFVFDGDPYKYFLYTMLKKEFEFNKEFEELPSGKFGEYNDIKYFGIQSKGEKSAELRRQVEVLYYNSKDDFAIKLLTKQNDEVIISKGINGDTFANIYEEINKRNENYQGDATFGESDVLKIPNIDFELQKEFKELENKEFKDIYENNMVIEKAMQTIEFELDKEGGKIKSEAGMMVNKAAIIEPTEPREFLVDNTFNIFLKENDKNMPYFAANIQDITKFQ